MPVLGIAIGTDTGGVTFEGLYDPVANAMAAREADSSQSAAGTTYGVERVVTSALNGIIGGTGGAPTHTTGALDTSWTFAAQVRHIIIQNNTGVNVNINFDAAASVATFMLIPGATIALDLRVTVVHLYTAANQDINGGITTNPNSIVILGWK